VECCNVLFVLTILNKFLEGCTFKKELPFADFTLIVWSFFATTCMLFEGALASQCLDVQFPAEVDSDLADKSRPSLYKLVHPWSHHPHPCDGHQELLHQKWMDVVPGRHQRFVVSVMRGMDWSSAIDYDRIFLQVLDLRSLNVLDMFFQCLDSLHLWRGTKGLVVSAFTSPGRSKELVRFVIGFHNQLALMLLGLGGFRPFFLRSF